MISALGAVLQVAAFSFPQLIVGRVVNGVGNGMLSSTCGIFQAESCASGRRGKLSVIVVCHNVVFYCIATWTTLACYFTNGGWQWRLPLGLQVRQLSGWTKMPRSNSNGCRSSLVSLCSSSCPSSPKALDGS